MVMLIVCRGNEHRPEHVLLNGWRNGDATIAVLQVSWETFHSENEPVVHALHIVQFGACFHNIVANYDILLYVCVCVCQQIARVAVFAFVRGPIREISRARLLRTILQTSPAQIQPSPSELELRPVRSRDGNSARRNGLPVECSTMCAFIFCVSVVLRLYTLSIRSVLSCALL